MFAAEIDANGVVLRVLVVPYPEWPAENLGGTWVDATGPDGDGEMVYPGIGFGCDLGVPERFVSDHWTSDKATIPAQDGSYFYDTQGMLTWHQGKAWRNLLPDGNPNVFAPPTNWREYPMGDEYPMWVQPSGAFDAYPVGFAVEHNGSVWVSNTPANVWEPGAAGITQWDEVV